MRDCILSITGVEYPKNSIEIMLKKLLKLITNPKDNVKRIKPYIYSRYEIYRRFLFEAIGNSKYSQPYNGSERLYDIINNSNGFFVELGGNDGFFHSPTYFLEKFKGWKGILVEPLSAYERCKNNRKKSVVYNYACVSSDYTSNHVAMIDCNAMSVIKGSFEGYRDWIRAGEKAQSMEAKEVIVECRTLTQIIDEYVEMHMNHELSIDLLVLDVEGYEADVLEGLDFLKYCPKYLLIEIHDNERRRKIEDIILPNGYCIREHVCDADFLYEKS